MFWRIEVKFVCHAPENLLFNVYPYLNFHKFIANPSKFTLTMSSPPMKRFATAFLFFAMAFSVNAQGLLKDYYLHTFAGSTSSGDTDINGKDVDVEIGSGYSVGIAVGRSITKNFRLELEWSYRNNNVDDLLDATGRVVPYALPKTKLDELTGDRDKFKDPNLPETKDFRDANRNLSNPAYTDGDGGGMQPRSPVQSVRGETDAFESDITYSSILINAYYDYSLKEKLSIYGGGGIGLSIAQSSLYAEQDKKNIFGTQDAYIPQDFRGIAFTYQVVLGLGYKVNENFSLAFAYKFFVPGEFDDIDNLFLHSFDFGATYLF
jgi:opacity protein-like surface antigen